MSEQQVNYRSERVPKRLDVTNARDFQIVIDNHFKQRSDLLILDFEVCTFIDSSGLALLIHAATLAREANLGLRLVHMNQHSRELIRISQLDRFLPVFDTLEQALAAGRS